MTFLHVTFAFDLSKAGDQTQNQSTDGAIYSDFFEQGLFLKPSLMMGGVFKTFSYFCGTPDVKLLSV